MSALKIRNYTCGLAVMIATAELSLYSYCVRELLASAALLTAAFSILFLAALAPLLAWHAIKQVAIWGQPASRNVVTFPHRLIAAYARS